MSKITITVEGGLPASIESRDTLPDVSVTLTTEEMDRIARTNGYVRLRPTQRVVDREFLLAVHAVVERSARGNVILYPSEAAYQDRLARQLLEYVDNIGG